MKRHQGFALVTALLLIVVLGVLLTAYFSITNIELSTTKSSIDSTTGFYAAEAALNLRGEEIRETFKGYSVPTGTSPNQSTPCEGSNVGSGHFVCKDFTVNGRTVSSYVVEDAGNAGNGTLIDIPLNETFGGLKALEQRYSVFSRADNPASGEPEALLEMVFRSRLVPLFQFAAFYNKDLEILPGPDMLLNGRVHVNGDLYLNANNNLDITGQVTVAKRSDQPGSTGGTLYRRRKNNNDCHGTVRIDDLDSATGTNPAVSCSGAKAQSYLDDWNGQIQTGLGYLRVPVDEQFDPGGEYWTKADLRIALDVSKAPPEIFVAKPTISEGINKDTYFADTAQTLRLTTCLSSAPRPYTPEASDIPLSPLVQNALEFSKSMKNKRENETIQMLEVDVQGLLDCLHTLKNSGLSILRDNVGIDDTSEGGLVFYFTIVGNDHKKVNNYGIRLRNGADLSSSVTAAPDIKGLTVVSDQAVYIQGDYNEDDNGGSDWRPASVLADSLNVLSNNWDDSNSDKGLGNRTASSTEINTAFLANTDSTGDKEGADGQSRGNYNGGLENYPRFHEQWSGKSLTYKGSFVSLGAPEHVDGKWSDQSYGAPGRDWSYDTRFNDPQQLPPLSPRFVYLRQELFVRDFEQ